MEKRLADLTNEEMSARQRDNACVPARDLRALINALIAKGLITEADLTPRKGRD
jgi:hypothetical protein